jgi:hypothetical protein
MADPAEPRADDATPARSPRERDRLTVRRALIAGAVAWALVGGPLVVGLAPAGGQASAVGMLLGFVIGGIVASGWLLVAAAIDLRTDQPIGRRRVAWTVGVTAVAALSPVMVAGVGG